jgi:hypothetical protein
VKPIDVSAITFDWDGAGGAWMTPPLLLAPLTRLCVRIRTHPGGGMASLTLAPSNLGDYTTTLRSKTPADAEPATGSGSTSPTAPSPRSSESTRTTSTRGKRGTKRKSAGKRGAACRS